jgi:hypothetical protein
VAEVTPAAVSIRSRGATDERRCQRQAVTRGLCAQHAAMRECAYSACAAKATVREGDWWFCKRHGRLYRDHNLIVQRIHSIPARD